jgi:hypothetical protein
MACTQLDASCAIDKLGSSPAALRLAVSRSAQRDRPTYRAPPARDYLSVHLGHAPSPVCERSDQVCVLDALENL